MTGRISFTLTLAVISLLGMVALIGVWGCASKQTVVTPESKPPVVSHPDVYPFELKVESGDRAMTLRWRQHSDGTISGYNIFISPKPLLNSAGVFISDVTPHNTTVYPGDTNPDDSVIEYVAGGLENGVIYYAAVRVVFPDQTMSKPTNEVRAICGPRGEFALSVRFKSDNDGYSLVSNKQVRADASDNDLYFYTKDGEDYLASPSRLDGYQRKSRFLLVSREGTFEDVRSKVNTGQFKGNSGEEKLAVKTGNWVLLRTAEEYTALIHVADIVGANDSREIRLSYSLCPFSGDPLF